MLKTDIGKYSPNVSQKTLLIADDHTILRDGLQALLSRDFEIVGEAENGLEAARLARELKPDLIVMDLSMPLCNGTEAISSIKRRNPEIKIIVLTVHHSEEYVRASLDAGADGYVLKDDSHHELLAAIHHVLAGRTHLSSCVARDVVYGYLHNQPLTAGQPSWDRLSSREREVLKLIAEGKKNREIGTMLSVSHKTVEKHRGNVMRKLDLHSASALTTYAIENKLVTL